MHDRVFDKIECYRLLYRMSATGHLNESDILN